MQTVIDELQEKFKITEAVKAELPELRAKYYTFEDEMAKVQNHCRKVKPLADLVGTNFFEALARKIFETDEWHKHAKKIKTDVDRGYLSRHEAQQLVEKDTFAAYQ